MFLVGNLIVALLSALVPFIIVLYEIPLQYSINKEMIINQNSNLNEIIFWLLGFSIFAFLYTFVREIIKDCEDMSSDISANANTIPIILGQKTAKIITVSILFLTLIAIIFTVFTYIPDIFTIIYASILVIIPTLFLIYKIILAKNVKDFHFLSTFTKIIMLTGVLYSIIVLINF
jgi:4-hydroxybenzoate polyprenyltransferase